MNINKDVIFIAAENGALPNAKVGGVGDVIRDLPAAVASLGWRSIVLTPSYGSLHLLPGAKSLGSIDVEFEAQIESVSTWLVPGNQPNVANVVFDHSRLAPTTPGVIYHSDAGQAPYAIDAEKFAFFGAAAATWISTLKFAPAALHLHDWHSGVLAVLREYHPDMARLQQSRFIFSIHNLSYQGQRPFANDESSLARWFPALHYDPAQLRDDAVPDCFNPMATCIRMADAVNTVSPSYKNEIQQPSDASTGFIGGEGLEADLAKAQHDGRLFGILNGCDYDTAATAPLCWDELLTLCEATVDGWLETDANKMHALAARRIANLRGQRPFHLVTSVGRIVAQKMQLFFQRTRSGRSALHEIMAELDSDDLFILLGSGESEYEEQIFSLAEQYPNLVFFRGYSEALGQALYASGDVFLMPSSFEPCGISQMIAMKHGQPCVVHAIGGLADTVSDCQTGFTFSGRTSIEKATNFVATTKSALAMRAKKPAQWESIRRSARQCRFEWRTAARRYIGELYEPH